MGITAGLCQCLRQMSPIVLRKIPQPEYRHLMLNSTLRRPWFHRLPCRERLEF